MGGGEGKTVRVHHIIGMILVMGGIWIPFLYGLLLIRRKWREEPGDPGRENSKP